MRLITVRDERGVHVRSDVHHTLEAEWVMGILFHSKAPVVSSYAVSLLLFLNVRNIFKVFCICGIIVLHSWTGQHASMVATCEMMRYLADLTASSIALAL